MSNLFFTCDAWMKVLKLIGEMNDVFVEKLNPNDLVLTVSKYEYNRVKRLLDLREKLEPRVFISHQRRPEFKKIQFYGPYGIYEVKMVEK